MLSAQRSAILKGAMPLRGGFSKERIADGDKKTPKKTRTRQKNAPPKRRCFINLRYSGDDKRDNIRPML